MAITIQKKTLKLKTDAPVATDGAGNQPDAATENDSVVAAVMTRTPETPRKSGGSFAPFVVIGLIACALLGTLIAMQVVENSFYTGAIPQAGAGTTY